MDKKLEYFLNNSNYKEPKSKKNEIITSRTYTSTKRVGRWSKKENELFFKALKICGLEFTLIENLFKNRTRKQIKNKFRKEIKNNENKIKDILKYACFDKNEYEKLKRESKN